MEFVVYLFMIILVVGMVGVASSPTPYLGALGLVLAAAGGCGVLAVGGQSYLSLILLLIYLGGMLVVIVYTTALAADYRLEGWGELVFVRVVGCCLLAYLGILLWVGPSSLSFGMDGNSDYSSFGEGAVGVASLYSVGGIMLVVCGWVLLLTLFVVLEVARGSGRGGMKTI